MSRCTPHKSSALAGLLIVLAVSGLFSRAQEPKTAPLRVDHFGDPLPAGTLARLGTVRLQNCYHAVFTPDGKTLVGVSDKYLHLWDTTTARELPGFPQSKDWPQVRAAAISPDGKLLAVAFGSGAYSFDICELPSGKLLCRHRGTGEGVEPCQYTLAFSPDSKTFVIANQAATQTWDVRTGKKVREIPNTLGLLCVAAVSPAGKRLVTSSSRGSHLHILDVGTGKVLHDLGKRNTFIGRAAFSRDGSLLATDGHGTSVRIWDTVTGKLKREIPLACNPVSGGQPGSTFAFSPDGATLAMTDCVRKGSPEQRIQLWNLSDPLAKPRVLVPPPGNGLIAGFSPDGKTLLWRTLSSIRLLDAATGKDRHGWAYRGGIFAVAWSPDGALIATGCEDGSVSLWDAATAKPLRTLIGHRDRVGSLAFSPDSKYIVSCGTLLRAPALLWDTATGAKKAELDNNRRTLPGVKWAGFSADGRYVFTGGHSIKRGIFETATGKLRGEWEVQDGSTWCMAFSPDGRLAASGVPAVCVYDLGDRKVRYRLKIDGQCAGVAFSPDGRTLAALVNQEGVILWEMFTGRERARFPMRKYFHSAGVAFSPDCRLLAWTSQAYLENHLHVWDLATRKPLGPFPGHLDYVTSVAFSPDGRRLATASIDGTVLIHDIRSGRN